MAFANKFGFPLSKRLVDAEIAQIPGTKGLNGQFSEQAYQQFLTQQRLSDSEVRQIIAGGLLQRLLLTPVATNARVSVGMASPMPRCCSNRARARSPRCRWTRSRPASIRPTPTSSDSTPPTATAT